MLEKIKLSWDGMVDELVNKTTWPTWEELQNSAIVTLIAAVIIAVIILLMDSAFDQLFNLLYKLVQ